MSLKRQLTAVLLGCIMALPAIPAWAQQTVRIVDVVLEPGVGGRFFEPTVMSARQGDAMHAAAQIQTQAHRFESQSSQQCRRARHVGQRETGHIGAVRGHDARHPQVQGGESRGALRQRVSIIRSHGNFGESRTHR